MIHNTTCAKYSFNTQDSACAIVYNGRGSLNKILSLSTIIKTAQSIHKCIVLACPKGIKNTPQTISFPFPRVCVEVRPI